MKGSVGVCWLKEKRNKISRSSPQMPKAQGPFFLFAHAVMMEAVLKLETEVLLFENSLGIRAKSHYWKK